MAPTSAYQPSLLFLKVSTRPPIRLLASIMVTLSSMWTHDQCHEISNMHSTMAHSENMLMTLPYGRHLLNTLRRSVQRCPHQWLLHDEVSLQQEDLYPRCREARCNRCLGGTQTKGLQWSHSPQTPRPRLEPEELTEEEIPVQNIMRQMQKRRNISNENWKPLSDHKGTTNFQFPFFPANKTSSISRTVDLWQIF